MLFRSCVGCVWFGLAILAPWRSLIGITTETSIFGSAIEPHHESAICRTARIQNNKTQLTTFFQFACKALNPTETQSDRELNYKLKVKTVDGPAFKHFGQAKAFYRNHRSGSTSAWGMPSRLK